MTSSRRRRAIIPEVIQISATDCGPASLKSLFAGMGVELNYRVLREVCQTDVDGTSIVTLDEVANQLGLDAEEVMLPIDHLVLPEAKALPAIIVTLTAGGRPHFVVLWKRVGPFVQVMDPAVGRHWTRVETLLGRLYQHTTSVPATAWREWAGTAEAVATIERRLVQLGAAEATTLVARTLEDPDFLSIARLDAAIRATEAMVRAGAVRRGAAAQVLQTMNTKAASGEVPIPPTYWSVRPNPEAAGELLLTGAVLMRVRGWRTDAASDSAPSAPIASAIATEIVATQLSPARTLLRLRNEDPWFIPMLVTGGLVIATFGRILQALMLRAVLDLGRDLGTIGQRTMGLAVIAAVALALLLLQIPISLGLLGIGRRLEVRLRKAYFEQLPKTEDRYFQSRLASDMAQRTHHIQAMRSLPLLIAQAITISLEVVSTTVALIWAAPHAWGLVVALSAVTLLVPLLAQQLLFEPDLGVQAHAGALSRFTLNALVGLTPIRIHGAERSLRRAQETLLVSWTKARYWLQALSVGIEAALMLVSYGLVVLLVYSYLAGNERAAMVLLVVYWALRFPVLGQRLLIVSRAFPNVMNRVRRLLDIIAEVGATPAPPPEAGEPVVRDVPGEAATGVAISMDKVRVKAGGHTILDKVTLTFASGEHVAIVGVSGAGKSTLVGLLLGWLRPVRGEVKIDGQALDHLGIERLRRTTAWVDPSVSIWNESLLDNLRYGNDATRGWSLDAALRGAEMLDILEALPAGLQTTLGEGGGLVSGGQGQRVRLARAMLRSGVRLAILDEPFRGLDRDRRARLLAESRRLWANITLLCVTHDVEHTQTFDRVLVVENGRVLENGSPKDLLANPASRYSALLRADQENRSALWSGGTWRHWWLADGRLMEKPVANGDAMKERSR